MCDGNDERKATIMEWMSFLLNMLFALPVTIGLSYLIIELACICFGKSFDGNSWPCIAGFVALASLLLFLWGRYQYRLIIRRKLLSSKVSWSKLLIFLGILMLALFLLLKTVFVGGNQRIQAKDYAELQSKGGRFPMSILVPETAKDIDWFCNFGGFGGYACLKCSCSREGFLEFGALHGYVFKENDISGNANPDGPQIGNGISMAWEFFHPISEAPAEFPENTLSYNYFFKNGGGRSFMYDIDGKTLYAFWSHR